MSKLFFRDYLDHLKRPDGGTVEGLGLNITWQRGPIKDATGRDIPTNGAFVTTVIEAAKHRIEFYQTTEFACTENAEALMHLDRALAALESRLARRAANGTLGTHQPEPKFEEDLTFDKELPFAKALAKLLNHYGLDNKLAVPDYKLAEAVDCYLSSLNKLK